MSLSVSCAPARARGLRAAARRGTAGPRPRQGRVLRRTRVALVQRRRDPPGRARRAARAARDAQEPARRRGAVRGRSQAPAAVPPARGRPRVRSGQRRRARCRRERATSMARSAVRHPRGRRAGRPGRHGGERGRPRARRADRRRRHRRHARRRFGRGPAAVLRRGPRPQRSRRAARRSCPPSATRRTRRCSTWWPTSARRHRPTPRGASSPTSPSSSSWSSTCGRGASGRCVTGWRRRSRGWTRPGPRPVLADPNVLVTARADDVASMLDRSRRALDHRLLRAADDVEHVRARVRALSPLATLERGYAVVQADDGRIVRVADDVAPRHGTARAGRRRRAARDPRLTAHRPGGLRTRRGKGAAAKPSDRYTPSPSDVDERSILRMSISSRRSSRWDRVARA